MNKYEFFVYLAVMAGITYLIRLIPLAAVKKRIKNRFLISFLYYIPYAVLSVMTIPAIFYSTGSKVSAVIGFLVATVASYMEKSLVKVASLSCAAVFTTEIIISII